MTSIHHYNVMQSIALKILYAIPIYPYPAPQPLPTTGLFTVSIVMSFPECNIVVVQLLSHVSFFATSWTAACQASLSITISQGFLKPTSIELVMPSDHLIFCCPCSSCPQSYQASGSFPMNWVFASGGQNNGVSDSASVFPMNTQG